MEGSELWLTRLEGEGRQHPQPALADTPQLPSERTHTQHAAVPILHTTHTPYHDCGSIYEQCDDIA